MQQKPNKSRKVENVFNKLEFVSNYSKVAIVIFFVY